MEDERGERLGEVPGAGVVGDEHGFEEDGDGVGFAGALDAADEGGEGGVLQGTDELDTLYAKRRWGVLTVLT